MAKLKNTLKEFKQNTWDKADESIARQYTKLTKKWEEKGHSRYSLSRMCSFPNVIIGNLYPNIFYSLLLGINWGLDGSGVIFGNHDGIKQNGDKKIIKDPVGYHLNKIFKPTRLPLFLAGAGLVGKSGLDIYDYFANGSPINSAEVQENAVRGLSLLFSASSIYIRGSDNSLLEKQPMWKQAYESLKEKIFSPSPTAEPVPVKANSSLEGRV